MASVYNVSQLNKQLENDTRLIFTHGTFDLFHIGHLALLDLSKKKGGKLIVGVESDQSTQQYKHRKPYFNQNHRFNIISKLKFVDYIVVVDKPKDIDEDYFYMQLYANINPDLITLGPNSPYMHKIRSKCDPLKIDCHQIHHPYTNVSTTHYLNMIKKHHEIRPSDSDPFLNN